MHFVHWSQQEHKEVQSPWLVHRSDTVMHTSDLLSGILRGSYFSPTHRAGCRWIRNDWFRSICLPAAKITGEHKALLSMRTRRVEPQKRGETIKRPTIRARTERARTTLILLNNKVAIVKGKSRAAAARSRWVSALCFLFATRAFACSRADCGSYRDSAGRKLSSHIAKRATLARRKKQSLNSTITFI